MISEYVLETVFVIKILFTLFVWCIPLLFFPAKLLTFIGIPEPINIIFLRLLGMAYAALMVGYIFGLIEILRGDYPIEVIWVGIVSNGGAFLLLLIYGFLKTWRLWGLFAQIVMWISIIATGSITFGLVSVGLRLQPN
jgi:hypothetical protein